MTSGVDSHVTVGEISLKPVDPRGRVGIVLDQVGSVIVFGPARRSPLGDITTKASWVVAGAVGERVGFNVFERRKAWAEVGSEAESSC